LWEESVDGFSDFQTVALTPLSCQYETQFPHKALWTNGLRRFILSSDAKHCVQYDAYYLFGEARMKVKAPPYSNITVTFDRERSDRDGSGGFSSYEKAQIIAMWPQWWPAYMQVLHELFSRYDHDDLLKNKTRVNVEKLVPNKKLNWGANLYLQFSFDDTGITWDIFQKDRTIVHAQPVF
jgi:hypothetical protein